MAAFAVRLVPSTLALFGGTLIAGIAISIGNVLLPAAAQTRLSQR